MTTQSPPTINPVVQKFCSAFLRLMGWRVEGQMPAENKLVMIAGPHTSNWDFVYMLACLGHIGIRVNWLGKNALFRPPYGWFMTMVGGLPVDRSKSNQLVSQIADTFASREKLLIGLLPEGTRSKRDHWKSGFYYMAQAAETPILVCSVDYVRRVGTIGPLIPLGTSLDDTMEIVRDFLKDTPGKFPEKANDIRLKGRE